MRDNIVESISPALGTSHRLTKAQYLCTHSDVQSSILLDLYSAYTTPESPCERVALFLARYSPPSPSVPLFSMTMTTAMTIAFAIFLGEIVHLALAWSTRSKIPFGERLLHDRMDALARHARPETQPVVRPRGPDELVTWRGSQRKVGIVWVDVIFKHV